MATETIHVRFVDEDESREASLSISCHDLPPKLQECMRSPNDVSKLDWIYPTATRCLADDLAMLPPLTPSSMFREDEEETTEEDPHTQAAPLEQEVAKLPGDLGQVRDDLEEALQTSCLFRAQAGKLLVRVEAATPHYGRRLAKMAAELISHAEAKDKVAASLMQHLPESDETIWHPQCLPMPESWTLSAAAKVLRKEGKESLALDLERLASRASGCPSEKFTKFDKLLISARLHQGNMKFFGRACSI